MKKKGVLQLGLQPNFLSCNNHLELIVFLHPWVLSNKLHELQEIQFTHIYENTLVQFIAT